MRFKITLKVNENAFGRKLPLNYQREWLPYGKWLHFQVVHLFKTISEKVKATWAIEPIGITLRPSGMANRFPT